MWNERLDDWVKWLLCLLGIHDYEDYKIDMCTGYDPNAEDMFCIKPYIIKRCSRCPVFNARNKREVKD